MESVQWTRPYVAGKILVDRQAPAWNCMGRTRWNLLLTEKGSCTVENEFGAWTFREHDMVLCAPSARRSFLASGTWVSFWFHFTPRIPACWPEPVKGIHLFHADEFLFRRLREDAMEAYQLILAQEGAGDPLADNLLTNLILRGNLHSKTTDRMSKMLRCAEYLASVSENPRMDAVARRFGMSRAVFYAEFKQALGVAPHVYFEQIRIRKVKHLLAATDLPLAEIAAENGFGTLSYLSRRFRAVCGMSPGKYRKTHATDDPRPEDPAV